MEAALRAGVERVVHTSSVGALGPARAAARPTSARRPRRALERALRGLQARRRAEALRVAGARPAVVIVSPRTCSGRATPAPSTGVVRRFLLRRIPAYVDGAINVVDVRDVAAGTCSPTSAARRASATSSATATTRWERLFAELGAAARASSRPPSSCRSRPRSRSPRPRPPLPARRRAIDAGRGARRRRTAGPAARTKARRELGWTTRPHEETVEATVRWWKERLGDRLARRRGRQPLAAAR